MDITVYVRVFGAVLLGLAMRTLLPYLVVGLVQVQKGQAWPGWEWKYMASFGLAIVGYVVIFLTTEGAFIALMDSSFIATVSMAYGSQDIIREVLKALIPAQR
jgi:hypothetical protein